MKYPTEIGPFDYYEEGSLCQDKGVFGGQTTHGQIKWQHKRTVHVYSPTGALFGTDKTDANGGFEIFTHTSPPPGDYTAEVEKETFGGPGHKHVCKPDPTPPTATVRESSARSGSGPQAVAE